MGKYSDVVLSSAKEALIFNVVGAAVAVGALYFAQIPVGDSFGFILLIESTGLMLVGGGLGVAGQATTRKVTEWVTKRKVQDSEVRQGDRMAALYALTGVMLFVEAFALAILLG